MSPPRLATLGASSTIEGIILDDFRYLVASLTKFHIEQQRIIDILSTWDRSMELTKKEIKALNLQKLCLTQKLLIKSGG